MKTKPLLGSKGSNRCRALFKDLRSALRDHVATIATDTLRGDGGESFTAGKIMVCAVLCTGPVPLYISRVTGIDRRECVRICWRLRKAQVFGSGGVYADPWAYGDGLETMLNFTLDAMIGADVVSYDGPRGKTRMYSVKEKQRSDANR